MARPRKKRRICQLPCCQGFGPSRGAAAMPPIYMAVEEYECLRLMDYDRMTQAECAAQMDVARTTVQGIYETARQKLARCLVEGRHLIIEGGDYTVCGGREESRCHCRQGCCPRHANREEPLCPRH